MQKPSPIFLNKTIDEEFEIYERKIRIIQNEFAGNLKQDDAVRLLDWIAINRRLRMRI